MTGFLQQIGNIVMVDGVETKRKAKRKQKELFGLLNGLANLLGESF